ncbi:hypothetical protein NLI96_g5513 [Meripilus lineatus]|uniref:F-box domain-containing protein n=1 Tax=Meripilus lineatus TaxID=2056292 RepID=A0AAD5YER1_9APHY|nr:hypothetical protein NLI96_g5513 [Physisporinus lineatus]
MQNRRIPQDIVDHVIDFLHGDRKTLCNTSTVAKDCVITSRRHLFHKIKVERLRGVFPFDFLAFVETNPHIAIYIKQLRIQGDLDNDAFPKLLAALPNLSVLSIRDWFSPMRKAAGPVERKYPLDYLLLDVVTARGYSNYPNKLGLPIFEGPTVAGVIDGPGDDGPGLLQRDPSCIDATRHSNFLSLFSTIQELDLRLLMDKLAPMATHVQSHSPYL